MGGAHLQMWEYSDDRIRHGTYLYLAYSLEQRPDERLHRQINISVTSR